MACIALMSVMLTSHAASAQEATFQELFRPQYHFSPAIHWMNDPNGMVYFDGEYHLFYQHNPEGIQWGHMSWGHAVSEDLVHWTHLPVGIPETDSTMAFSGSAVVDWDNTSGFGTGEDPPLVAIYTAHYTKERKQAQYVAYSNDRGRTWLPYEGNPVLDVGMADFRDPKVFWYEPAGKWIMVVALSLERKLHFYRSDDLKSWQLLSSFGPAGSADGIWECPDLFELNVENEPGATRWVLEIDQGSEAVAGGSGGQYFVGNFDGSTFTAEHTDTRWVDYGKDFYAAVSWADVPKEDGRTIWLGWLNNWLYANIIPTHPWRSAQSIPRSLSLRRIDGDLRMVQRPVEELQGLRQHHRRMEARILDGELDLGPEYAGKAMEIVVELDVAGGEEVGMRVHTSADEATTIGFDARRGEVFVDRRGSGNVGFHPAFAGRHSAPASAERGRVRLHVFVDWSSVEVFAQDGAVVLTDQVFPSADSDGFVLYAKGGTARLVSLDVWTLSSIWK